MKSSIILPEKYEKIFMLEAQKVGLVKPIDFELYYPGQGMDNCDDFEYLMKNYSKCHNARQQLFQMMLLYDDLVIPVSDPTYDYNELNNIGGCSLYSLDNFANFDPIHEEGHEQFAEYLKPVLLPSVKRYIRKYINMKTDDISYTS